MEKVLDNLYRTKFENPFKNSVTTCAYLIKRDDGNFLIYSSAKIEEEFDEIKDLGGISKQFLGHHHEASGFCDLVRTRFNASLTVHDFEKEKVNEKCEVSDTFIDSRDFSLDFSAYFTPGHTKGSSCYLWRTNHEQVLFTGDFFYLKKWRLGRCF